MEEKIRVTTTRDIIEKKTKIPAGSKGLALADRIIYKKKKPQKHLVNVIFDDGQEYRLSWAYLIREVNDDEQEGDVIKYAKKS